MSPRLVLNWVIVAILRRIGKILSAVPSGHFLASAEHVPKLGTLLFSSSGKELGRVEDVLGPVSSPFLLVRPHSNSVLPGAQLFVKRGRASERRNKIG
jgi:RNA-binding protein